MTAHGFVHLHTHTQFSLLDGAIKVKELAARTAALGMPAVAITDHGNLFGAIEFHRAMTEANLRPVLGMEAYVAAGSRHDRASSGSNGFHHLVLLARNQAGWRNLVHLASIGYLEGFYYKPRIDREALARHSEGLIGLSACLRGEVNVLARAGKIAEAERAARSYAELFDGQFYLELQDHGIEQEALANQRLLDLSRATGIPLVASNDCHYLEREHAAAHDILLCIQTNHPRNDPRRLRLEGDRFHLRSPEEMEALFSHCPEALANTVKIAEQCDVPLKFGSLQLPCFPLPEGFAGPDAYLEHLAWEGARRRYGDYGEAVSARMRYELDVIRRMEYAGYFLIVRDFIEFARSRGVPVGPGRGSAAGSIVSYAVGITNIDPLAYDLLFERFLNPERVSMPDIDVDFSDRGRAEVIRYVIDRYGAENVCQIITFGTMAARAVVRDVGRVMGMSYPEVDRIAKLVPGELKMTLEKALAQVPELRELADGDARVGELLAVARVLEGLTRHASTHAAGVVITPTPLAEHAPLFRGREGEVTTQWDMVACEKIGLLKMDLLGLRTLTVVQDALALLARRGVTVDIDAIPFDDRAVFALMSRGETVGVFQFESAGMMEYLRKLQPERMEDLIAMNALYRPGPLGAGMVDSYIARKQGREKIVYEHPCLEPILASTYGTIVYQEQVMQIASCMAGYRLGEADELRRAMAKKKREAMKKHRDLFLAGGAERKIPRATAEKVFDLMAHFAEYGFNRSHSAGYAVLAYQTAWLKAHHPVEFMAASLTSETSDTERILVLLGECRRMGIEVLPPDVNASEADFTVWQGRIRFGLAGVKGLGLGAAEGIVRARECAGRFRSLHHFCAQVESAAVNKKAIEALIHAGALDGCGATREQMIAALPAAIERAAAQRRDRESGQSSLFGGCEGAEEEGAEPPLPPAEPWDPAEALRREKAALGFYLTRHPLDPFRTLIACLGVPSLANAQELPDRTPLKAAGIVTQLRAGSTQKGEPMSTFTLEDFEGRAEVFVFGAVLERCRELLGGEAPVWVSGRVAAREGRAPRIFADSVRALAALFEEDSFSLHLGLSGEESNERLLALRELLASFPEGGVPVFMYVDRGAAQGSIVQCRRQVRLCGETLRAVASFLGDAHVRLRSGNGEGLDWRQIFRPVSGSRERMA
ncbi:MAG: DNA polymerase III subunit alpha [Candidatus Eisenbacteria bacterium]|nr:DNA polymerase III subunit alpha [Candidatus Eisenbacteria bacterium]